MAFFFLPTYRSVYIQSGIDPLPFPLGATLLHTTRTLHFRISAYPRLLRYRYFVPYVRRISHHPCCMLILSTSAHARCALLHLYLCPSSFSFGSFCQTPAVKFNDLSVQSLNTTFDVQDVQDLLIQDALDSGRQLASVTVTTCLRRSLRPNRHQARRGACRAKARMWGRAQPPQQSSRRSSLDPGRLHQVPIVLLADRGVIRVRLSGHIGALGIAPRTPSSKSR
ncbi:hypothetical protein GY45DRAFT_1326942 [Cubamyces sp. BRFM 1775]|nr:hypothetical protein GY45DRAFT_1326942 [Cubamyces sp. BRFM 1775]